MIENSLNDYCAKEKLPINHELDILAIVSASQSNLSSSDITNNSKPQFKNNPTYRNSSYVNGDIDINSDDFDDSTVLTPTSSCSPMSENMFRSLLNYGDVHHRVKIPKYYHKNSSNNVLTAYDSISDTQKLSTSAPPNLINGNITIRSSGKDEAALKKYKKSLPIIATKRYAKTTKDAIENISKSIINIHSHFKTTHHKDLFPPGAIYYDNDSKKLESEVQFKVKVPVSETHNYNKSADVVNSFGQLKISRVFNPETKKVYARYIHYIGIDFDLEDGRIYKHPANKAPNSFFILKSPDTVSPQSDFQEAYSLQLKEGFILPKTTLTKKRKYSRIA